MRRYNKKKVLFLLVPLLIIIFLSGNATADTYSFSAGSTLGDGSGHLDDLSLPEETFLNHNDTQEVENVFFIETNKSGVAITSSTDPYVRFSIISSPKGANISIDEDLKGGTPSDIYFDRPGIYTFKLEKKGHQTYEESLFIDESGTLDVTLEQSSNETPTLTPEAKSVIDEEYNNATPSRINFDRPGNHTFKLVLNGTLDVILEPLPKENPTSPTPVPEPLEVFEKNQKTSGNATTVYKEESPTKSKSKSSSAFFHPSPTPPGFLAMHILIAIFLVYFLKFKNKR